MDREPYKTKFPSELRFDLVSRDWVVIATGRSRRPETFKKERRQKKEIPQSQCPFCQIQTQEPPTLVFSHGKKIPFQKGNPIPADWTTVSIPNKFPAFIPHQELHEKIEGNVYLTMNAVGFHEVVITRDRKSVV